jgi:threonine dehydrogenase-like Zn-dependent dehydrogenase
MRVPFADQTLERVPPDLTDEQVICVGDAFSSALHHASLGGDLTGRPAAVLGLGLAGLLAVLALRTLGADPVIAVDVIPERLERARGLGAEPLQAGSERVGRVLRERTEGRGVAMLIDTAASAEAITLGLGGLRAGGTLVFGGTYTEERMPLPVAAAWKSLRIFTGVASTREWNRLVLQWIAAGRIDLAPFVTDTLPLADAPAGFLRLDRSPLNGFTENYNPVAESCLKVVLKP